MLEELKKGDTVVVDRLPNKQSCNLTVGRRYKAIDVDFSGFIIIDDVGRKKFYHKKDKYKMFNLAK
jgi:hypothetical protein